MELGIPGKLKPIELLVRETGLAPHLLWIRAGHDLLLVSVKPSPDPMVMPPRGSGGG